MKGRWLFAFILLVFVPPAVSGIQAQGQVQDQTPAQAATQAPRTSIRAGRKSDIVVTATRIARPVVIDGRLDDEVYQTVEAITAFIQQEPHEGQPISEETQAWVHVRRQESLRFRQMPGQPARTRSGDGTAPRQRQHLSERQLHHRHRYLQRPAQRVHVSDQCARRRSAIRRSWTMPPTKAGTRSGTCGRPDTTGAGASR